MSEAKHSNIVGGSTAKRVMACPGSVALCAKMPRQESSSYADRGTLLHAVMTAILGDEADPKSLLGMKVGEEVFTEELLEEKVRPALAALNEIDPETRMMYDVETVVDFGDYMPGVFGSCDLLGKLGNRAIILDWKFGDGVAVGVEENEQLMFYTAAAMRTIGCEWAFKDVTEIECVIVQPPYTKRWVTTPARVKEFERELKRAVKASALPDAPMATGDHCRWCSAKPVCPLMTGAVERANKTAIQSLDSDQIGAYLRNADMLEGWIKDLRALAFEMLQSNKPVTGWKLVAKRGVRKWVDEGQAAQALNELGVNPVVETVISPAQAEKLLKAVKQKLPDDLVVSVSSGDTLAPESDPRPTVSQFGAQLVAALTKLN